MERKGRSAGGNRRVEGFSQGRSQEPQARPGGTDAGASAETSGNCSRYQDREARDVASSYFRHHERLCMRKFLVVGVLWLIFGTLCAIGQGAPPLDTFTSPDGTFHFVYPQTYELLVGERILKATQGRHQAISVCDFLTAIACVIYPVETEEETRFEAA